MGNFTDIPIFLSHYSIGGHYGVHYDPTGYFEDENKNNPSIQNSVFLKANGDRIATFMGYLSNVPAGGKTVFPVLGIGSDPVEGDGIFWINIKSSGKIHKWTSHEGCPVIVGSKWITNKWIRYYDQFKKYKCHLKEDIDEFDAIYKFRKQTMHTVLLE